MPHAYNLASSHGPVHDQPRREQHEVVDSGREYLGLLWFMFYRCYPQQDEAGTGLCSFRVARWSSAFFVFLRTLHRCATCTNKRVSSVGHRAWFACNMTIKAREHPPSAG